jgi:hypothetical protein
MVAIAGLSISLILYLGRHHLIMYKGILYYGVF